MPEVKAINSNRPFKVDLEKTEFEEFAIPQV